MLRWVGVGTFVAVAACAGKKPVQDAGQGPDSGAPSKDAGGVDGGCTCSGLQPYCDARGGCVACLSDAQCSGQIPHCEVRPGNAAYGGCVQCTGLGQCPGGSVCDAALDVCRPDCRADGGSCGAGLFCDPGSGGCVACVTDADCAGSGTARHCDPATHACVECLVAADCSYAVPGCYQGFCGSCGVAGDCPPNQVCSGGHCGCTGASGCGGNAPVCVGAADGGLAGACGCQAPQDCGPGLTCDTADFPSGACIASCTDGGFDCSTTATRPHCDPSTGLCAECLSASQCADAGAGPYCAQDVCVPCLDDAQCAAAADGGPAVHCSHALGCVACTNAAQCPPTAPGCNTLTGACGSCALAGDCPDGTSCAMSGRCQPVCGLPGADAGCPSCRSNADCDGGTCDADAGACR